MEFEWDGEKSAKLKAERGASFEELAGTIHREGIVDQIENPAYPGQAIWVVRHEGEIWAIPIELRGASVRLITAYPNRKLRKFYEDDQT